MKAIIKRFASTGIASLAFALGSLAQGIVALDNSLSAGGVAIDTPGNYYTGTFGMEVWNLAAGAVPPGIDNAPSPDAAYKALNADGFWEDASYYNQQMSDPGTFSLGVVSVVNAPRGASVVLALAVWNNSARTWDSGLQGIGGDFAGVIAFVNPVTAVVAGGPPPPPVTLTGWTSAVGDLVLVPTIPEPGAFPLLGLGAAALLLLGRGLRRRRFGQRGPGRGR